MLHSRHMKWTIWERFTSTTCIQMHDSRVWYDVSATRCHFHAWTFTSQLDVQQRGCFSSAGFQIAKKARHTLCSSHRLPLRDEERLQLCFTAARYKTCRDFQDTICVCFQLDSQAQCLQWLLFCLFWRPAEVMQNNTTTAPRFTNKQISL